VNVNKVLPLGALGLGAVLALAALYGRFTESVPARAPSASASGALLPVSASGAALPSAPAAPPAPSQEADELEARRRLYDAVDALIRARELQKARRLLDEDQARYGDDLAPPWHDLEQSYRFIADCLEHPSPSLRVRARAFAQVSDAVSLRARILQACSAAP